MRLTVARAWIDHVDAAIVRLAATRRRAAIWAADRKPPGAGRDFRRESAVVRHVRAEASTWGLPEQTAQAIASLLIRDACVAQGLPMEPAPLFDDAPPDDASPWRRRLAAALPPPSAWRPLCARLPPSLPGRLLVQAAARARANGLAKGEFAFLEGRRLGIEVHDLGIACTLGLHRGRLCVVPDAPEATVRGSLVDLMLLASRLEDADTLFFQRRLVLVGDTALGLEARNVLDRLDWSEVPLALRVPLHRTARWLRALRGLSQEGRQAAAPSTTGPGRLSR
jgi:predicted lipid carrier protein YhbT/chorismate mutase